MATLRESVEIAADPWRVWEVLVDWESQGDWMLGTRVRVTAQDGHGVGAGIEGWTGLGSVGLRDPMTIRRWQPPERLVVRHLGPVLRGSGAFEIVPTGSGRCRFVWSEWFELPLGLLGRMGWQLVCPVVRAGVRISLRRLRRQIESGGPLAIRASE